MSRPGRTAGAEYALVLVSGAAAAGLLLLAVGRSWAETAVVTAGMPRQDIAVPGTGAIGWLGPVSLVGLAGLAATLATSGRWRQLVGAVVGLAAAAVAAGAVTGRAAVDRTMRSVARETAAGADDRAVEAAVRAATHSSWQWVTVGAALGLAAAGLAVVARGRRWPGMSRRYEQPAPVRPPAPDSQPDPDSQPEQRTDAQDLWRALDEGRDPTR
ncbi:MAG: Trp biosynthesis-associated membrane protein [Nocardioidaceae bacterium]|nr:Trp biosynthesis-associated membrane protein [Nocardioidaceae bacterium]